MSKTEKQQKIKIDYKQERPEPVQVAGEWKEYTKAGCGYKTDSEEENAFELKHQDSLDAAIPQLNPCRRQKKRDKVNADVARIVSEVDQLDKDHDYETDLKKQTSYCSDPENEPSLPNASTPLRRKRNLTGSSKKQAEGGMTSTSEDEPRKLGQLLRLRKAHRDAPSSGQISAFSSGLDQTTSATEADKLTTTDNDGPMLTLKTRFTKGIVPTAECSDETASDAEVCDKGRDARYHHLAMIASSGEEEQVTKVDRLQPQFLRDRLLKKHRKQTSEKGKISSGFKLKLQKSFGALRATDFREPLLAPILEKKNSLAYDEETPKMPIIHAPLIVEKQESEEQSVQKLEVIIPEPVIEAINQPAPAELQQQEQPQPQKAELKDDPIKGILFFIANTIFMTLTNTMSKQQFIITPSLTVFEALFARGVVSVVLLALYMNRNLKADLIDGVDRSNLKALIFRCGSGCLVQIISFQSIKYFDVSTVSMVCSLAPLFTCIFAYYLLGERMHIPDMVFLFSVFCCVILVLLGANKASDVVDEASVAEAAALTGGALAFLGLIAQPVLVAGQTIASRQMRKMGESVVSFYLQLSLTILIGTMMFLQNATFSFIYEFTAGAWIFLIGSAIINILGSMTKFIAIKYHKTSDLQKLAFLPNVWQFIIDIVIMHAVFSGLELTGFICLFVFYAGYLAYFVSTNFNVCGSKDKASAVQDQDDDFKEAPQDLENAFESGESKATADTADEDSFFENADKRQKNVICA